jgi:hypothetical protein
MTDDEKKFEHYVHSLRFDDAPSTDHQDKLEKQLLEAYDQRQGSGDGVEPVSLYLRKLSIAAGFLIAAGVLFWGIDNVFITRPHPDFIANHPERDTLEQIIENEQVTGTEKKNLIAEMSDIWKMIRNQNADGLVSVLGSDDIARSVRAWAAGHLGQFGNQRTLDMLDSTILKLGVTDPNDPLKIAASEIRKRLNLPEAGSSSKAETSEAPSMTSLEKQTPETE